MVLVLCIGDLHIPHRATDLPPKFKALVVPGKISHILCPGNLCTEVRPPRAAKHGRRAGKLAGGRAGAGAGSTVWVAANLPCRAPLTAGLALSNTPVAHLFACLQGVYDYLRSVCSDVTVTQGDFDESTKWPDTQVWCGGCGMVWWGGRAAGLAGAMQ